MKKLLLLMSINMFILGLGQNLSLSELLKIKTLPLDEMESSLTQKGWKYIDGKSPNAADLGYVVYKYFIEGNSNMLGASITKTYLHFRSIQLNRLNILFGQPSKYEEYLADIKNRNTILIHSGPISTGEFVKIYQGATTTFIIVTRYDKSTKNGSFWEIDIRDNDDFKGFDVQKL